MLQRRWQRARSDQITRRHEQRVLGIRATCLKMRGEVRSTADPRGSFERAVEVADDVDP